MGTGGGLNQLRRKAVASLAQEDGLGYGPVEGLARLNTGNILACKGTDGLFNYDGSRFTRSSSATLNPVHVAAPESPGAFWLGTGKGLYHCQSEQELKEVPPTNGEDVRALLVTSNAIWAGTRNGTRWIKKDAWTQITNFPNRAPITALAADPDGALWIGTEGDGLALYKTWCERACAKEKMWKMTTFVHNPRLVANHLGRHGRRWPVRILEIRNGQRTQPGTACRMTLSLKSSKMTPTGCGLAAIEGFSRSST